MADLEIGVFLRQDNGPEQQELLRLMGTLVDEKADSEKTGVGRPVRRRLAHR